jgi:hypothetical protein
VRHLPLLAVTLGVLFSQAPVLSQSAVMPIPLTGTGAGLQTAMNASQSGSVVASGPTSFYGITMTMIAGQGPGYVMLFDATQVPPDGTVAPLRCLYVDAGPRTTTFGSSGMPLSVVNGLAWAFSTGPNCQTKVAATANFVAVSYKQQRR